MYKDLEKWLSPKALPCPVGGIGEVSRDISMHTRPYSTILKPVRPYNTIAVYRRGCLSHLLGYRVMLLCNWVNWSIAFRCLPGPSLSHSPKAKFPWQPRSWLSGGQGKFPWPSWSLLLGWLVHGKFPQLHSLPSQGMFPQLPRSWPIGYLDQDKFSLATSINLLGSMP